MLFSSQLLDRCRKLGLTCEEVPTDRLSSPLAALACFPMYMIANVHAWTTDMQWSLPIVDLPGFEHIREAFAIGEQESPLPIAKEHRRVLGTFISNARPSDLIVYEFALETLKGILLEVSPKVAETLRIAIARMIVAVAQASGEGWLGTGPKISPEEKACIDKIANELSLRATPAAAGILKDVL
jgi:hypothetical protein